MTALAFIIAFVFVGAIYIGTLYLLSKKNDQEKIINSQQETIEDENIRKDIASKSVDELLSYVKSRADDDSSGKP